ncbi:hypothetical protein HAZT_HAZT001219 [Hyalella azteca]|nr:bifunctional coenzyme A synthase isoform X2 [Hyalella azteca]KAA0192289.1 hypothetical protein HAZT_HAZT001219 [Hyalella azteca]
MRGFLIITLPYKQLTALIPQMVTRACEYAKDDLYIHLDSASIFEDPGKMHHSTWPIKASSQVIQKLYGSFSTVAPQLDTRIIMSGFKGHSIIPNNPRLQPANLLVDHLDDEKLKYLRAKYKCYFNLKEPITLLTDEDVSNCSVIAEALGGSISSETNEKVYENIVAGGTFDRIHPGHKILLAEGLLRCRNRFTIGMADGILLEKKTLAPLIEPVEVRIENLKNLLEDMDPSIEFCLEPIIDPCGPSGKDPRMEMIIVSQETLRGGHFVNKTRAERNLNQLDVVVIDLVNDENRNVHEEEKLSSSSRRMRLLGTCLQDPNLSNKLEPSPYIIGLTGGSASGKSSIASRLKSFGASIIDCDKLGHKAYLEGTECYSKLVEAYGPKILNETGEINRKALGALVFGNQEKLNQLNSLVWPEILLLLKNKVAELKIQGAKLVVVDAAVLLEAQWDLQCHEVWVCVLPESEAVRRICERDGCSEELAQQRLQRQMRDDERVKRAHVVFCSLWDYSYTTQQVLTAWRRLQRQGIVDDPLVTLNSPL